MIYKELYRKMLRESAHGNRSNVGESAALYYLKNIRKIPINKASKKTGNFRLVRKVDGSVVQSVGTLADLLLSMAKGDIMQFTRDLDFISREERSYVTHKRQDENGGTQGLAMKEGMDMLQMWEDYCKQPSPYSEYEKKPYTMVFMADGKLYKTDNFKLIKRVWNAKHEYTIITNAEEWLIDKYPNVNYVKDVQNRLFSAVSNV